MRGGAARMLGFSKGLGTAEPQVILMNLFFLCFPQMLLRDWMDEQYFIFRTLKTPFEHVLPIKSY